MASIILQPDPAVPPKARSRWELFREYRDSFLSIGHIRQPLIDESSFGYLSTKQTTQKPSGVSSAAIYPW